MKARWALWATIAACVAALVPLAVFAGQIRTGQFHHGSSYTPRVESVIKASRTGMRGGPFASVREGDGYSLAPGLINDVGMAALADIWGRVRKRPVNTRQLAIFNLVVMAVALFALVAASPAAARPALAILFIAVPICVREYRSFDSVTVHGALAGLAIAIAVMPYRGWPAWAGLPAGLLLFAAHKIRSPYGLAAVAALGAVALLVAWRTRRLAPWRTLACIALAFVALEVPWRIALDRRARDPRVVDKDILLAHNIYNPLLSGIGWTENRWGVEPWDPKIVEFLAERTGLPPVGLATFESERRARAVYLDLWREDPGHLIGLYLRRIPTAIRQYFWLGYAGALAWAIAGALAGRAAWRRGDAPTLALLVAPAIVAAGLVVQIAVIDPRLLYSYPLTFVSALGLLTACAFAIADRRSASGVGERGRRGEHGRSEEAELGGTNAARAPGDVSTPAAP